MKFLICLFAISVYAQDITLKQIMADPHWMGEIPEKVRIAPDQNAIYFRVPTPIPAPREWRRLSTDDNKVSKVTRDDLAVIATARSYSNGTIRIDEIDGDLWCASIGEGKKNAEPLISRKDTLSFVCFTGSRNFVYREGHQLFHHIGETGANVQLTDIHLSDEPQDPDDFYVREERRLLRYVENLHKGEALREQQDEFHRNIGPLDRPQPTWTGSGVAIGLMEEPAEDRHMLTISQDLRHVAVVLRPEKEGHPTEYARFINKDGRLKALETRPAVGHETPTWKLAFIDRQTGKLTWFDTANLPEIGTDRLAEIKAEQSEKDRSLQSEFPEGPRPVLFVPGGFQPGGNRYLVSAFSRDYKDRWILLIDPVTGKWEIVHHHYDPAWVVYLLRTVGQKAVNAIAFWRQDGKRVMFVSDHDGYHHLYDHDPETKKTRALTQGDYEIYGPFEGPGKKWYFHANKEHPGEYHFYHMPLDGGPWTALTSEPGRHEILLSHDGKMMVDLFSKGNHPAKIRIKKGKKAWKTVYDGRSDAFKAFNWVEPEYITYPTRDGKQVHARLFKPENPNGAGVIFVHGAGYLQNAHKGWSVYFREYMFHNMLMQQGYTVLDPDYRASSGYGREWRTAIYRHMGGHDLEDVIDGATFLAEKSGIDKNRMGVYGGSYGGFITIMAMFTTPDVFKAGGALRPVTDWAYYNHWYTARILNTPTTDPLAYRRSSPIYFAEGLKGELLMCHGMVDDNVHYQDSVRLAQRLIELRKHNWELSGYPVEPHGFRTPSGWYDEYRRIYELFERNLKK